MTGTYLSAAILDELAKAQVVIDMHLTFSRPGVCGLCDQPEPCDRREAAQALFNRYGRLPRRTPMLTFASASRWQVGEWFQGASSGDDAPGCDR